MDISSIGNISNANYTKQAAELNQEDAKVNSFKDALEKASSSGDDEKLWEAAKSFESYFINMLYKQMRSTVNYAGGLFERSNSEVMFQEMLDEQYSEIATESGGIGLANAIYEQMKQE